jgi:hypothetical protein
VPRGRPRTAVRYFFDEVAGAVIAVGQGAVRVLKEIGTGVTASVPGGGRVRESESAENDRSVNQAVHPIYPRNLWLSVGSV